MLVKGLGGIDVIGGLLLIFLVMLSLPTKMLFILGIIFLAKSSLGLLMDFASWVDFVAGIMFLLASVFLFPQWIYVIVGILLFQKGIFSFL